MAIDLLKESGSFAETAKSLSFHYGISKRQAYRYVKMAERAIRGEPESWLWSNRRWKRDPVAEQAREAEDAGSEAGGS